MESDLGVLVDTELSMNEQCAAAAKKDSETLGCINKSITSRDEELTVVNTCQATPAILCSLLISAIQKRYGQARWGPEKGHKGDQRTGKPTV